MSCGHIYFYDIDQDQKHECSLWMTHFVFSQFISIFSFFEPRNKSTEFEKLLRWYCAVQTFLFDFNFGQTKSKSQYSNCNFIFKLLKIRVYKLKIFS